MRSLRLCFLTVLLFTASARADYYGGGRADTYDPVTGLYYKTVYADGERGLLGSKGGPQIVNIAIFTPSSGAVRMLFEGGAPGSIQLLLFETGFKEDSVEFYSGGSFVQNNKGVAKREIKPRLLVVVREKDENSTILFVADKAGSNLKELVRVPRGSDWHLDVKNSKLRVVHQTGTSVRLEAFEW